MSVAAAVHHLSEAEYLALERSAEFKSEFFDGEMFAMAGGTPEHSLIATNLGREFGNRLKDRPCAAYNSDLRVKVEATGLCTYPDLSVVCGPLRFAGQERDTIVNPTVLVEVLSDSTEAYDRGKKFEHYRRISSLREYLLVSQSEPRIEQFIRQENGSWLLREAAGLEAHLELPSLQIRLALAEVFARVEFNPAAIRPLPPPPA
ncbi:MAG: Uma2 family endonuclease [Verrucomicrobia bacterium]|nr:Uma2 family endonuclease [Verrucomicrobiota bacterium]